MKKSADTWFGDKLWEMALSIFIKNQDAQASLRDIHRRAGWLRSGFFMTGIAHNLLGISIKLKPEKAADHLEIYLAKKYTERGLDTTIQEAINLIDNYFTKSCKSDWNEVHKLCSYYVRKKAHDNNS